MPKSSQHHKKGKKKEWSTGGTYRKMLSFLILLVLLGLFARLRRKSRPTFQYEPLQTAFKFKMAADIRNPRHCNLHRLRSIWTRCKQGRPHIRPFAISRTSAHNPEPAAKSKTASFVQSIPPLLLIAIASTSHCPTFMMPEVGTLAYQNVSSNQPRRNSVL